jgi:hypothetical protein
MRRTESGRPYLLLSNQLTGTAQEVHPEIGDALELLTNGRKADGRIILHVAGGQIVNVTIEGPVRSLKPKASE